jgi:glycine cleavage system H protein
MLYLPASGHEPGEGDVMEPLYKCVWMTAGVLTFRLCDRGYDCDGCLVNQALCDSRTSAKNPGHAASALQRFGASGPEAAFHLSRHGFYDRNHTWVRVGSGGAVRVGLDDLGRRLLGRVVRVILPEPGSVVHEGEPAWTFIGEAGEVKMLSSITGRVLSRNESLIAQPELMRGDVRKEVWLARVRPARLRKNLERLLYGRRAATWLHEQVTEVRDRLLEEHAIGAGMAPDGGLLDPALFHELEVSQRRFLVEAFLLDAGTGRKGR